MAEKKTVPHKRSPNFVSHVATAAAINGPTGDGLIHFMFFRDAAMPISQDFNVTRVTNEFGAPALRMDPLPEGNVIEQYKEDLATISLPVEVAEQLLKILGQQLDKARKPAE